MDDMHFSFKIENPPAWLPIGRTAENDWRTIEIDCSYWFNMDATGNVVLMYRPSCGMVAYPLLIERDGENIVWHPKSGELVEGVGQMQAFFYVGESKIGSSEMVSCEVDGSLLGGDPGTDPGAVAPPWAIDIIEQIAELSGHYPKIIDGNLYIWDSTLNDWVEFEAGGGGAVESVNGKTGAVVLDASDVGALPDDTPIPSKTSDLTNDSGFVTAQQAAAAAPVQSVNGQTGAVTIPTGNPNAVLYTAQSLSDSQKAQARTNVGAGTYSKPSGGIPKTDLASGVIPSVPQMATQTDMSDWTSGKTVDASAMKTVVSAARTVILENSGDIDSLKSDKQNAPLEIPITTSDDGESYTTTVTAAQIRAAKENAVFVFDTLRIDATAWLPGFIDTNTDMLVGVLDSDLQIKIAAFLVYNNVSITVQMSQRQSIPTKVSELTNDSGYQTAQDVQTAIAAAAELPSVTASDNGKFLRVVNGAWAAQTVSSAESNSFGGGS